MQWGPESENKVFRLWNV